MVIGIDLGGTSIKGVVVESTGKIITTFNHPTPADKGREAVLNAIFLVLNKLKSTINGELKGIGVGTPGIIDSEGTIIGASPNIKGWIGTHLGNITREKYKVPVVVDNDVNSITMGEVIFGNAKNSQNLACIAMGTGIGVGLVMDGKLFRKSHEMGHIIVKYDGNICGCGRKGCVEAYVSARGLENGYKSLTDTNLTAKEIFQKYETNDTNSKTVVNDFIHALSSIIANIILSFSITDFVLAGGMSKSFDLFHEQLKSEVKKRSISHLNEKIEIKKGILGDDAGVLGAASLIS